ncbi:peptide-methionine (S)-S-oxide reductase MsrA [Salipiger bermudensis]|uniref:peptide-methionine (S)-S-oxide reductase MsrA n=1 Tax=Salipiger bermudensis TaxID=344736 RepID=UPI001CD57117|nr:peptide-methionine (S)-S-oxide reductase MsrA [Salipiger bermudensis]MCA0962566.1 peptide-methionine (S)-S-oxide reductase MsrA [Salipiger bermudensis]
MFRSIILSALIVMGLCVQSQRAEAGERRDIVVAGGCFWCVEADFEKVRGVLGAVSGYTGGSTENPTYKEVSRGGTGHYEAVKITYDSAEVSAEQLYKMFFRSVDPTDAGGQFCDRGESYRTAIFVSDAGEKAAAEKAKAEAQAALGQTIVTPILQAAPFYEAEDYHQDYYKSDDLILSRFGPISKAKAYVRYRDACGRDQRVRQLWGSDAPFVGG